MSKNVITAYKGFEKDLTCRGYQYEVGKEYEMPEGSVSVCHAGFHACESPLEVLDHYFLDKDCNIARYCEVEQSGALDRELGSTKVASSKIKIKAELSFADLLKIGIEWLKEKAALGEKEGDKPLLNDNGKKYAQIGSSGYSAKIGSSGHYAKIGSSGYSAQIGSSGDYAQIGSSGDSAKIGSSGYSAQIGSSGDYAQIGSSGDSAQIGSSGDSAQIGSSGKNAVVMCAGNNSIAKAKKGSWITLSEWKDIDNEWVPVCVKTEKVDGERIKEDTWYRLVNGEFQEV